MKTRVERRDALSILSENRDDVDITFAESNSVVTIRLWVPEIEITLYPDGHWNAFHERNR